VRHVAATNAEVNQINISRAVSYLRGNPNLKVCEVSGWDSTYLINGARGVLECNLATGWGLTNGAGLTICHQLFNPRDPNRSFPNGTYLPNNGRHRCNTSPAVVFVQFDPDRGENPPWLAWIRAKEGILLEPEFDFLRGLVPIPRITFANNYVPNLPLRLGWASTINKCQGASLDRIIVRLPHNERARGLTLVALSRCRTLHGMILENVAAERLIDQINKLDRKDLMNLYQRLSRLEQ